MTPKTHTPGPTSSRSRSKTGGCPLPMVSDCPLDFSVVLFIMPSPRHMPCPCTGEPASQTKRGPMWDDTTPILHTCTPAHTPAHIPAHTPAQSCLSSACTRASRLLCCARQGRKSAATARRAKHRGWHKTRRTQDSEGAREGPTDDTSAASSAWYEPRSRARRQEQRTRAGTGRGTA